MELKLIPGTLGFYAGSDGEIYDSNKVKRNTYRNSDCYVTASVLIRKDKWVTFGVHCLVALAFHGEPKEGYDQVNHRNGNISDNTPSNVEWVSVEQNNIHAEIFRKDNHRPSILGINCRYWDQPQWYLNVWDAAEKTKLDPMEIWDAIKDKKLSIKNAPNVWHFSFFKYSDNIPENLQKERIKERDKSGRVPERAVKVRLIDSEINDGSEVFTFSSIAETARFFKVGTSAIHQAIPQRDVVRIFQKKYQIAYVDQDFPILSEEDIERIQNSGPRSVAAWNYDEKRMYIFGSATEFLKFSNLSKKAVTVALAKNRLRKIDNWSALYLNNDNVRAILAFVNGSSQDEKLE